MLGPTHVYSTRYVLILRWFNMLIVQTGDDDCVANMCSEIEAELMRQGGRLPEWLIIRDTEARRETTRVTDHQRQGGKEGDRQSG